MIFLTIADWTSFIGRFHPLFVHLPIGFLALVVLLELLKFFNKISFPTEISNVILFVTALSASLSCVAGYFLSFEGGYNEEILGEHQNQGIALAIFSWLAWLSKNIWLNSKFNFNKFLYYPSLGFAALLMIIAGHHGGNLTHGETYLTENTPPPFRSWLGLPEKEEVSKNDEKPKITNVNEALVFQDMVKPIFKQKCEQCHNAGKMKGDLRMDEVSLLLKGGKHGAIFKPNDVDGSEFIKRILLPEADEEHMPPKGKNQITENELVILKWWIQQGASFDKKVSQLTQSDEIKPILATMGGTGNSSSELNQDKFVVEENILTESVSEVEQSEIEKVRKSGGLILPLSQNNNYVELTFLNNPKFSDNDAALISTVPAQTLWLKLSNTQITDNSFTEITKLSNLTRLHLENTDITDAAMNSVSKLQNLEYLNLTGTSITDKGIIAISSLKNLKKIYLWKTKVTTMGVENLKKTLPNLNVEVGINELQMAELSKTKVEERSDDVYKK